MCLCARIWFEIHTKNIAAFWKTSMKIFPMKCVQQLIYGIVMKMVKYLVRLQEAFGQRKLLLQKRMSYIYSVWLLSHFKCKIYIKWYFQFSHADIAVNTLYRLEQLMIWWNEEIILCIFHQAFGVKWLSSKQRQNSLLLSQLGIEIDESVSVYSLSVQYSLAKSCKTLSGSWLITKYMFDKKKKLEEKYF